MEDTLVHELEQFDLTGHITFDVITRPGYTTVVVSYIRHKGRPIKVCHQTFSGDIRLLIGDQEIARWVWVSTIASLAARVACMSALPK